MADESNDGFGQWLSQILQQRQLRDAMRVLNDETPGGGLAADTVLMLELDVFRDHLNAAVLALQDAGKDEKQIFRDLRRLAILAIRETVDVLRKQLERLENDDDGVTECSICLVEFVDDDEQVCVMPCPSQRHMFHPDCITRWLEISNTCPLCRHELPTTTDDAYDDQ